MAAVRYRVTSKLADGGMAEVFHAFKLGVEGFQKPVVLKRILPSLADDPAFVRMLVDEAHIASTLNHSNLVQVLDLGRSVDRQYFLVLELVDGWSLETLRRASKGGKVPLPIALFIVAEVCRALAYVHGRALDGQPLGIVHRDVTPHNVLISREGEVKLADFGIAKASGAVKRETSATGVIKGKFAYMSPEQASGAEIDHRSDLFSVGTLLYVLLTGKKPFDGASDLDVLMAVRKAKFDKPSTVVRAFNEDVEKLIARALRVDLTKRWQTAEQIATKIDAILAKLGQPTGPGAVKKWVESTMGKGVTITTTAPTLAAPTSTIEVGSKDIELEEVVPTVALGKPAGAAPAAPSTTRRAVAAPLANEVPTKVAKPSAAAIANGTPRLGSSSPTIAIPRRPPDRPRTFRRAALTTLAILIGLGATAYVARPYLPASFKSPIDAWIRRLPMR